MSRDRFVELIDEQIRALHDSSQAQQPFARIVANLADAPPVELEPRINPRKGRLVDGSAASRVLELMARDPTRWWPASAFTWALRDRSPGAVRWALSALLASERIAARPRAGHGRYFDYRLVARQNPTVDNMEPR